jgi:signal transduction histidine kinase
MLEVIGGYEEAERELPAGTRSSIAVLKQQADLEYLRGDILNLMDESSDGLNRVTRIVQDLKEFSHVDSSEWMLADLNKGLESTLNLVWNEIKYRATVVNECGELPPVLCVPAQLNQVFMNLLVNAAHAIAESGTITLRSGVEGDRVWIEVEDTGCGMPAEVQNRIFEPFFTTKPVGKGTGLGLSLAYGIVQKHDGSIEVASRPGVGSRFRVWLPLRESEPEEAHAADLADGAIRG